MLRDLLKSLNLREKQFSQKGELQPTRITVPFPPQKIGRNAQFSYNIEKRNSRVDENYSKRGENYANFVIFEQRNASILGTIIVSLRVQTRYLSLPGEMGSISTSSTLGDVEFEEVEAVGDVAAEAAKEEG